MSTHGGVQFEGKNLKLWKAISVGHTRDGEKEMAMVEQREKEAQAPIQTLGQIWDTRLTEYRSQTTLYSWIKTSFLDYENTGPMNAAPKNGELLEINLGNIFQAFGGFSSNGYNSPDGAVFVVKSEPWLPLRDLMTSLLTRWAWQDDPKNKKAREEAGDQYLNEFLTKDTFAYNEPILLAAQYNNICVEKLEKTAHGADPVRRLGALRILARGGWNKNPEFFEAFLKDSDSKMVFEALLALFLMPNEQGKPALKRNLGSLSPFFNAKQQVQLEKYLSS
jgi:hypothetical protein